MPYINVTYSTTKHVKDSVDAHWVRTDKTNFLKKHIAARGVYCILVPASFVTSAIDVIIGLGAGIGTVCTLGKHRPTYKFAYRHIMMSNNLCVFPYQNFLQIINPSARYGDIDGFLVSSLIKPIMNMACKCRESDNFLKRHVASRLTYALAGIVCLITRTVDGVLSVPLVALSILTVGKCQSINNWTCKALKAPGIVSDLCLAMIYTINPSLAINSI